MLAATVDHAAAFRRVLEKWKPPTLALDIHDRSLTWEEAAGLLSDYNIRPRTPEGTLREDLLVVKDDCCVAYLHPPGLDIFSYTNYGGTFYSSTKERREFSPGKFETNTEAA